MTPKDHRSSKISSEAIFATPSMRFSRFIIGTILCIVVTIVDLNSSISNKIRGFSHDLLIPFYLLSELPSNIYREIDFTLKTKLDLKKQIATLERQTYLLSLFMISPASYLRRYLRTFTFEDTFVPSY